MSGLILLLGALAALPPLGIDMGLPALARVEAEFGAAPGAAGATLSVFLAGFGVAQLILGPLSDRLGRRPVLLGGLAVFAAGGVLCALAPSLPVLLAARAIEGAGAAAGTVLAMAITRDVFEGAEVLRRLATIGMVLGVAPVVAPTLGGWVLLVADWRAIYAVLGASGLALLVVVAVRLPETHRPGPHRLGTLAAYGAVLRDRPTRQAVAVNALNFAGMFAYVAGSAFVLMGVLGLSPAMFGAVFAATAGAIVAGAAAAGWLSRRNVAGWRAVRWGQAGQFASALGLVGLVLLHGLTLPVLLPLLMANTFCRGLVTPGASHAAMQPWPQAAGVAAAATGAAQMAAGAAAAALVAALSPHLGPLAMVAVMATSAGLGVLVGSAPRSDYG